MKAELTLMSKLPPSADSADGRQFRRPITGVSVVAGGGITSKMDQGDRLLD